MFLQKHLFDFHFFKIDFLFAFFFLSVSVLRLVCFFFIVDDYNFLYDLPCIFARNNFSTLLALFVFLVLWKLQHWDKGKYFITIVIFTLFRLFCLGAMKTYRRFVCPLMICCCILLQVWKWKNVGEWVRVRRRRFTFYKLRELNGEIGFCCGLLNWFWFSCQSSTSMDFELIRKSVKSYGFESNADHRYQIMNYHHRVRLFRPATTKTNPLHETIIETSPNSIDKTKWMLIAELRRLKEKIRMLTKAISSIDYLFLQKNNIESSSNQFVLFRMRIKGQWIPKTLTFIQSGAQRKKWIKEISMKKNKFWTNKM